jgi:hypothetical protein
MRGSDEAVAVAHGMLADGEWLCSRQGGDRDRLCELVAHDEDNDS